VPAAEKAILKVLAMNGKEIARHTYPEGQHTFTFKAGSLPAGVYAYTLTTSAGTVIAKRIVVGK
jgi:hypothetical protein